VTRIARIVELTLLPDGLYVWCVMLLTFVKLIIALLDTEVKIIVVLCSVLFSESISAALAATVARLRAVC
jgi:hypothetical protein